MTGKLTPAITQGQKLSILFALASSIAHALPGAANSVDAGWVGDPGCVEAPGELLVGRREGERMGEEKERR